VTVELKPDTERLVQEEIRRGHFHSLDELIVEGVNAWREKHRVEEPISKPRKKLYDLLTQPPSAGSELSVERQKDESRPIDLS
jgi:Arc/MetJ-type ribon-helix-helix transcriptional regulator